jgi:beta-phosphoglucomutase-like phosphatase (HAD superfamily)
LRATKARFWVTIPFPFDLDGTLIDSVCQHVIAWRAALPRLEIGL